MYLATLVLLGLAFRSILIPIKSIVLNTLTVAAAFGVITLVFQYGMGARLFGVETLGFVDNSAPIFIFAIVFGLSMDYEVFLVARLYEAHRQGLSDRDAVVQALSATGGVISSAALVMLTVFSVFIFSEVVLIKTFGIGLWVAIFCRRDAGARRAGARRHDPGRALELVAAATLSTCRQAGRFGA